MDDAPESPDEASGSDEPNANDAPNDAPPPGEMGALLAFMWLRMLPAVLRTRVARMIARGALTWADIFEDGNIILAICPMIGWSK